MRLCGGDCRCRAIDGEDMPTGQERCDLRDRNTPATTNLKKAIVPLNRERFDRPANPFRNS
jgi:hypothetical protein